MKTKKQIEEEKIKEQDEQFCKDLIEEKLIEFELDFENWLRAIFTKKVLVGVRVRTE